MAKEVVGQRPSRWRLGTWTAIFVAFLSVPALSASGHASLAGTDPADGAELPTAPSEVTLTFTEPVEVPTGAIRIFDATGQRVDAGDAGPGASPEKVAVSMPADSAAGAYVVTWRAVSLDGHPVRGAFMFQVGEGPGAGDESLLAAVLGEDEGTPWAVANSLARWVTYLAALTAAGAAVFDRWLRAGGESTLARFIGRMAAVGAVGSAFQIPIFAAEATGLGWEAWVSTSALGDALTSPVASSAGVRIVGLALLAWAVRKRTQSALTAVAAATVVGSELVSGHTLTTDPQWLVMSADAVHVAAAALWLGGLVGLHRLLSRREEHPGPAASTVARFSTVATWSVGALVVAGSTLAWAEVRAFWALTATPYGWTLLVKIGVAAVVLGFGLYNNRVLVPAIGKAETGEGPVGAWRKLTKVVRIEVVGLAVVLAVTAVLVNLQPAAEAAGVSGPYSVFLPFGEGELNLVVDPNRRGTNQVHAYVLTETGSPWRVEGEATMEFTFVDEGVGPLVRRPQPAGPGHWIHTGPELAIAGTWEIEFLLGDGLDQRSAVAEVRVNP